MATARNQLKPRIFTMHPTFASIRRAASFAERWGAAHFYADLSLKEPKFSISNVPMPELEDMWILTTGGTVTAWEVEQWLWDELD